ncbi:MAG: hypothetical protein GEU94_13075 [Micromonosporaceae bacterium]|nr:hypothetical protein [Micromonosporaceae bacterium]
MLLGLGPAHRITTLPIGSDMPTEDKAWVDAANPSDHLLVLTPEQLKAMSEEIRAVVQRYRAQPPPRRTGRRARRLRKRSARSSHTVMPRTAAPTPHRRRSRPTHWSHS